MQQKLIQVQYRRLVSTGTKNAHSRFFCFIRIVKNCKMASCPLSYNGDSGHETGKKEYPDSYELLENGRRKCFADGKASARKSRISSCSIRARNLDVGCSAFLENPRESSVVEHVFQTSVGLQMALVEFQHLSGSQQSGIYPRSNNVCTDLARTFLVATFNRHA